MPPRPQRDAYGNEMLDPAEASAAKIEDLATRELITKYLKEKSQLFVRLNELRKEGWNNPDGDKHFQKQRKTADHANDATAQHFYRMMQEIGDGLQAGTGAFRVSNATASVLPGKALDFCMAPGGFLATFFKHNDGACSARAFTLPPEEEGHKVLLAADILAHVQQTEQDITMLAADMGLTSFPASHPDAAKFLVEKVFTGNETYDLVIADGKVLRNHVRAAYRENREARRLTVTQLALGVENLAPGGTMVVLLHKVEAWQTVVLLGTFSRFADVQFYKHQHWHGTRSSFYMVAKNVRSQDPAALQAIGEWKEAWRVATMGDDEEYEEALRAEAIGARAIFEDFAPQLVEMGTPIWKVQADALSKVPWTKKKGW